MRSGLQEPRLRGVSNSLPLIAGRFSSIGSYGAQQRIILSVCLTTCDIFRVMANCPLHHALKVARERSGLTLRETAKRMGVSLSLLSRFESGTRYFSAAQIK